MQHIEYFLPVAIAALILFTSYPQTEMRRASTVDDILSRKHKEFEFSEPFYEAFGSPEQSGIWFAWGDSGNGKTSFVLQLMKELSHHGKVAFISLEEHYAKTFTDAVARADISTKEKRNMLFPPDRTMEIIKKRMSRHKSPKFYIIDSVQFTGMSYPEFLELRNEFADKLIIFISQVDGKKPMGRTAVRMMFAADLKIWIEGFVATSKGRYIGPNGGRYIIWKKGAEEIWGKSITTNISTL